MGGLRDQPAAGPARPHRQQGHHHQHDKHEGCGAVASGSRLTWVDAAAAADDTEAELGLPSGTSFNTDASCSFSNVFLLLQVSPDIWLLFQSIYGGGPEVMIRPNGSIQVNTVAGGAAAAATAAAGTNRLQARIRARSISENNAGGAGHQQQTIKQPKPGTVDFRLSNT